MTRPAISAALLLAATSLVALPSHSLADACHDRFVRLLVEGNGDGPVKIHATQEIKGAPPSTNYFYQTEPGHWMTETIEPAGQPWVLTYNNTMYTSADEGETWTVLRELDSVQNQDAADRGLRENAETVKNAKCGEEVLDGVAHDTVEADYTMVSAGGMENHTKYWVNRETGYIDKTTYLMKSDAFESLTTQMIEKAPGLDLPKPE
jgi:hypothetical protein